MKIATSLRTRIKRLEKVRKPVIGIAARLRIAGERWEAMSPEQQELHRQQRRARDIAALSEPDIRGSGMAARLQRASRRMALYVVDGVCKEQVRSSNADHQSSDEQ